MIFFSRGSHGRNNRGRGNWNRGPRRPKFSIHFDANPQELNQLFQAGFFNWIGQGIVQPRSERPPFSLKTSMEFMCLLMCPCNQKSLQMMDGKRLSTRLSLTIMAGPIFHYLLHHLTILMSRFPMLTHLFNPHMLVKD